MRIANLTHARLHWRDDGDPDGLPVVFANSLGTDLRLWDPVLPLLPSGLRLIRFDKRGHGLSSCPAAPYAMSDLITDTEELLDQLGVSQCLFIGLSIGGMIGQGLAYRRPDLVQALVLSNTGHKMGEAAMWADRIAAIQSGGINSLAEPILDRWFGPGFRQRPEVEGWRNMLTRTPQDGYIGCCHAIAGIDLGPQTATLTLPALGIGGSVDGASPSALVRKTTELIPGATYVEIENAGHLPCVEAPAEYAAHLTAFIQEIQT